jgi:hypothetical protein
VKCCSYCLFVKQEQSPHICARSKYRDDFLSQAKTVFYLELVNT